MLGAKKKQPYFWINMNSVYPWQKKLKAGVRYKLDNTSYNENISFMFLGFFKGWVFKTQSKKRSNFVFCE